MAKGKTTQTHTDATKKKSKYDKMDEFFKKVNGTQNAKSNNKGNR